MNVLSLFDGMSCGQIALKNLNIPVDKYYASEIEKPVIKVTQQNFPDTIQLGDVTKVKAEDLPQIDLLIGGSPCQGFSFAGKQLNFEDPRSKLFFEYVRLLKECKPKYFLLENVRMKKEYQDAITEHLGMEPIFINSALVSAQDRKRIYWTNIPNITQPEDKHIYLKDILDPCPEDSPLYPNQEVLEKLIPMKDYASKKNVNKSCVIGKLSIHQGDRIFDIDCKGSCLCVVGRNTGSYGCNLIFDPETGKLRKLSVNECRKLQTIPDWYIFSESKCANYKMLGNGWTVDVISHILSHMELANETL